MVEVNGIEPSTSALRTQRSPKLSYTPIFTRSVSYQIVGRQINSDGKGLQALKGVHLFEAEPGGFTGVAFEYFVVVGE